MLMDLIVFVNTSFYDSSISHIPQ